MSTQLAKIAEKARQDKKIRFTSLAHLITPEFLQETWGMMNRKGASGVDGETTAQFEANLKERTEGLWKRLRQNRYQAPPVRRVDIPKGNGKTRPLGIPMVSSYCTPPNLVLDFDAKQCSPTRLFSRQMP
jgi:retron-type reverse transcriptase